MFKGFWSFVTDSDSDSTLQLFFSHLHKITCFRVIFSLIFSSFRFYKKGSITFVGGDFYYTFHIYNLCSIYNIILLFILFRLVSSIIFAPYIYFSFLDFRVLSPFSFLHSRAKFHDFLIFMDLFFIWVKLFIEIILICFYTAKYFYFFFIYIFLLLFLLLVILTLAIFLLF